MQIFSKTEQRNFSQKNEQIPGAEWQQFNNSDKENANVNGTVRYSHEPLFLMKICKYPDVLQDFTWEIIGNEWLFPRVFQFSPFKTRVELPTFLWKLSVSRVPRPRTETRPAK